MIDLSALTPALPASPIMPNPAIEAAETGEFAGIDFAALLGLQLRMAPLLQVRAATAGGKEGPASGKALPDPDPSAPDVPEDIEVDPLNIVLLPTLVVPSLPFVTTAPDPLQPAEQPAVKGTPLPSVTTPAIPQDSAAVPALPIHAAPRAAEALAARLDLRFETPRPELPEQASARAVEVHAARLAGLRPGPASPDAGSAEPAPANPITTRAEPAIAPIARGPMPDAAPQGRSGKAPKEQAAVPQVALPASLGEPFSPVLAAPAAPAPAANPSIAPTPTPEAPRADFGALVDRLAEARDAAGTEPVRLALRHAEFGQVALHIRSDDSGLSVTMASPDPDFARAVSAAVPAASAAQGGESLPQSDSGQSRSSSGASTGSDPGGNNRSNAAPERRTSEERHRPSPSRPDRDPSGDTRSGIFA